MYTACFETDEGSASSTQATAWDAVMAAWDSLQDKDYDLSCSAWVVDGDGNVKAKAYSAHAPKTFRLLAGLATDLG